jgi:hypothetical protein
MLPIQKVSGGRPLQYYSEPGRPFSEMRGAKCIVFKKKISNRVFFMSTSAPCMRSHYGLESFFVLFATPFPLGF